MDLVSLCLCFIISLSLTVLAWLLYKIFAPEFFNQINIDEVKSSIDGDEHNVQKDMPCPSCAADRLAEIKRNSQILIGHLERKYPNDPRTKRLADRYDPDRVFEGKPSPGGMGDTSYSLNKGQRIVYCIRSARDPSRIHDINHLGLVYIHELTHVASAGFGHGNEFQKNLKWMLKEAVEAGIYQPINYRRKPREYCGIIINSNPYFD